MGYKNLEEMINGERKLAEDIVKKGAYGDKEKLIWWEGRLDAWNWAKSQLEKDENNDLKPVKEESQEGSRYGGVKTIMRTLPVGTKFYVHNGVWEGEVVEVNGEKGISIGGEFRNEILQSNPEHTLNITIIK